MRARGRRFYIYYEKEKYILLADQLHMALLNTALEACMWVTMFIPDICGLERGVSTILWYVFCGILAFAVTLMWLGMLRFAVADDNGVSIFCLFLKVTRIDWDDVASAEIGCALSPNPKVPVYMRWIILRPRANRQWQLVVGGTKRKSRAIYIAASRRNIGIIGAYVHVFGCTRYPQ